jgi:hypothetical protein
MMARNRDVIGDAVRPLWPLPHTAKVLNLSERTLKSLVARGAIKVVRVSPRRIAFDPADVGRYIDAQRE